MGKVLANAKISNLYDLHDAGRGVIENDSIRSVTISDALVDTGATMLCLPKRHIDQLGLKACTTKTARTAAGIREFTVFGTVLLEIQGRDCRVDVAELPDDCPALIGQVPLELLDFVVDPQGQRLIGNPDHGGKHMIDMF